MPTPRLQKPRRSAWDSLPEPTRQRALRRRIALTFYFAHRQLGATDQEATRRAMAEWFFHLGWLPTERTIRIYVECVRRAGGIESAGNNVFRDFRSVPHPRARRDHKAATAAKRGAGRGTR